MSRPEHELRGRAAVVGVAESALGEVGAGISTVDLIGQATVRALADAGLRKSDIDAIFCHSAFFSLPTVTVAEYLGIRPRFTDSTAIGGSSFVAHLRHAALAIEAGLCEVALITYGSIQRSASRALMSSGPSVAGSYETPFGPRLPISAYALAAARHMHEFGTTREQLAEVAVAARQWAQRNPVAFVRDELTVDDVLSSRMISSPLTVRDCCLVTDGGGAVLVTSAERARDLAKPPVYLLGAGEAMSHMSISQMPDLTRTMAVESGRRAYEVAGFGPEDVDLVQLYDAFTINTILFLEDLGFCAKGEGGAFVEKGRIAPGGQFPVNTNGGGLSYCHPGMYGIFLIVEAVRQVRGECGDRQVDPAHLALIHGNGGHLSTQVTALLGDETTL
ncbi:MAG TPA: thiolase [Amycolatopsis sp.]|nr:thiolase [Amycolatopsis sp.]